MMKLTSEQCLEKARELMELSDGAATIEQKERLLREATEWLKLAETSHEAK